MSVSEVECDTGPSRLVESKREFEREECDAGIERGREWATETATYRQLRALRLNARSPAHCRQLIPNILNCLGIDDIWEQLDIDDVSEPFAQGFFASAMETYEAITEGQPNDTHSWAASKQ